jgi:hypothetical protein
MIECTCSPGFDRNVGRVWITGVPEPQENENENK